MTSSLTSSTIVPLRCRVADTFEPNCEPLVAEFEEADIIGEGSDDSFDAVEEVLASTNLSNHHYNDICANPCTFCSVGFDTAALLHDHLLDVHETAFHERDSSEEFYSDDSSHGSQVSIDGLEDDVFTDTIGPPDAEVSKIATEVLVGEASTVAISEAEQEHYDDKQIVAATCEVALKQATVISKSAEETNGWNDARHESSTSPSNRSHEPSSIPTLAPVTAFEDPDNSIANPSHQEQHNIAPLFISSTAVAISFDGIQPTLETTALRNDLVEANKTRSTEPSPERRSKPMIEKIGSNEAYPVVVAPTNSLSPSSTMGSIECCPPPKYTSVTPSSATCLRYVKICGDHKIRESRHNLSLSPSDGLKKCFIDARYAGGARASLLACAAQVEWVELPFQSAVAAVEESTVDGKDDDVSSGSEDEEVQVAFNAISDKVQANDQEQHICVSWLADGYVFSHLYKCLRAQESHMHQGNANITKHVWLNHFPGASQEVHKATLSKELNRLRSILLEAQPLADSMDFYPRSFLLPADEAAAVSFLKPNMAMLTDNHESKRSTLRTLIVKPSKGSQGKGIRIIQDPGAVRHHAKAAASEMKETASEEDFLICQEYLSRPVTLGGLKFDLRLYLLVVASSNMNEPDAWLCREGLARFATIPYRPPSVNNLSQSYMHLTNYSLNKDSSKFHLERHKRPLSSVLSELVDTHAIDETEVWNELSRLAAHTLMAITPSLVNSRRAFAAEQLEAQNQLPNCFQIFGLDVMLTHDDYNDDEEDEASGDSDEEVAAEKASRTYACLENNCLKSKHKRRVKASLLEVNANPAMSTTAGPEAAPSAVDVAVKGLALRGALQCVKNWDERRARVPPVQWWKHGSVPVVFDDVNSREDDELVGYMRVATAGRWCGPQQKQQQEQQPPSQKCSNNEGSVGDNRMVEEPAKADGEAANATGDAREEKKDTAGSYTSALSDDAAVMRCGDMLDEARRLFEAFAEAPTAVQESVVDGIKTSQHQERDSQRRRAKATSAFWTPATAKGAGSAHSPGHAHCAAKASMSALTPTPETSKRSKLPRPSCSSSSSSGKSLKAKPPSAAVPSYLDLVTSHVHAPCNEPVFRLNKAQFVDLAKACLPVLRDPDSSSCVSPVSSPRANRGTHSANSKSNPWLSALTTRSLEALYDDATRGGGGGSRARRELPLPVGGAAFTAGGSRRASASTKRGTLMQGQGTSPGRRTSPPSSAPAALPHEGSMSFSACLDALGRLASALRDTTTLPPSRQCKASPTTKSRDLKEARRGGRYPRVPGSEESHLASAPVDALSLSGFITRATECVWAAASKQVE